VAAAALLAAAAAPRVAAARAGRPVLDLGIDRSSLPLEAIAFVEENGLRERMYNDFEIGSYLAFQGFPRYRVFVDPRMPAYPLEMHRLLGELHPDHAAWDAAMSRYGVDSALLAYAGINRRVSWWDPQRWALVWRSGDARVFVRRLPRWRALIAAREIPATFSFTVEEGTATHPLEPRPAASPVSDCEWQRRIGDLLFDLDRGALGRARPHYDRALEPLGCLAAADEAALAAYLGGVDLGAGRPEAALGRLDRALALAPADSRTRANRAAAYRLLGRHTDAAADWARVAAEARGTPLGDTAAAEARR
jgi:tetratricopeptide (TPR) repeat protein